jgi:hypothetical protein
MRFQPRPLQQRPVFLDRAADLALLAIQVAEHEPQFERSRIGQPRRALEFFDREIDLAGHQVVQPRMKCGDCGSAGDRSSGPRRACSVPRPCPRPGR